MNYQPNPHLLLLDHKADFSFEDLLTFITGADHLHPLGLSSQIYLRFYSQVRNFPASLCKILFILDFPQNSVKTSGDDATYMIVLDI